MDEKIKNEDELIEIKPDLDTVEDDSDMTISTEDIQTPEADFGQENTSEADSIIINTDFPDDFSRELEELENEREDEEMLSQIGASLTRQMDSDLETMKLIGDSKPAGLEEPDGETEKKAWFLRIPLWAYAAGGAVIVIAAVVLWFAFSDVGQSILIKLGSNYVSEKVNYVPVNTVTPEPPAQDNGEEENVTGVPADDITEEITPEPASPTPTPEAEKVEEKKVYNILLIGEENLDSGIYRGRTDLLIIATLNLEQKAIKLTSIMRDSLVSIPGYQENRINAVYAIGGVALLYETIKQNFGIEIDNYALVRFDGFESIIDSIGGISMSLTAEEAEYLNRTNYISDEASRNVVEGINHLNGSQALGYCRIRYVGTKNNEFSDFGRTARHRELLTALFNSIASLGYSELLGVADTCLPYITTDLTAENIESYLTMLLDIGFKNRLESYRIPIEGSYKSVYVRDMLVTQMDIEENREALQMIIYGE